VKGRGASSATGTERPIRHHRHQHVRSLGDPARRHRRWPLCAL